jgi:prepilin-type processing-associated H-X9-DG protein
MKGKQSNPKGTSVYPEYWTDMEIKFCPSDSQAISGPRGMFQTPPDPRKAVEEAIEAGAIAKNCLGAALSAPNSYFYTPYLVQSHLQIRWLLDIRVHWGWAIMNEISPSGQPWLWADYNNTANMNGACADWTSTQYGAVGIHKMPIVNQQDIPSTAVQHMDNIYGNWYTNQGDDDPTQQKPRSYSRLKEGIERFLITDINNPAASSKGQSQIVVMFDAWANGGALEEYHGESGVVAFNHIPGGSNVLYMDGHVEFKRYKGGFPLGDQEFPNAAWELGWALPDMCGNG